MSANPFSYYRPQLNPYRDFARQILELGKRIYWDFNASSWKSRKTLIDLRKKYNGEKAVIVCNGPSLLKSDLSLIGNIYTFGLNKINLLFDKTQFRPSSILCFDSLIFQQNLDFLLSTEIPLFLAHKFSKYIDKKENVTYLYSSYLNSFSFAQDCLWNVGSSGTVTFVALQLALHCGFKDVAIIGCDHNYKTQGLFNSIQKTEDKDINHFDPNYTTPGQKWQVSNIAGMNLGYVLAKAAYEYNDARLVNCTEGGYLEIFPRMPLEKWVSDIYNIDNIGA